MNEKNPTGMVVDGIAASEAIDSSGEILDVEGCDISDLQKGVGVLNYEHRNDESNGASSNDVVGKIIFAKKIFSESECSNDRERHFWSLAKGVPIIYIKGRLFDGAGHQNAANIASIIRDSVANDEQILVRFSIEGSTLDKKENVLKESIARKVAMTLKPCNRTCFSGVLADPMAPEGFSTGASSITKGEEVSGDVLSSATFIFSPLVDRSMLSHVIKTAVVRRVVKAITAGSYDVAPSKLSGGAAAQKESHPLSPVVLSALKTYSKNGSFDRAGFKVFLKSKMPEVSDAALDRFADVGEDYKIKSSLLKADGGMPEPPAPAAVAPKIEVGEGPATIRGRAVPNNPELKSPHFDEGTGTLHTQRGSFPMYVPSKDAPEHAESFHRIMNDPKVEEAHNRAMENWSKVNGLLKAGMLPPEVVMHGTLFSQLSPNTPVGMQELMYGHLVDHMRHTGIDARDPKFGETYEGWKGRDQAKAYPEHARDYYQGLGDAITLKSPSKFNNREPGDMQSFMLANNKFENMSRYHSLHNSLVDLVNRYRGDARGAVEELMKHKKAAKLHENRRKTGIKNGKGDIGPYTAGPDVPGLAPKTGRYTYGMLGGGNVTVPDTHFTRYLFGMEKGKDNNTIDHLKDTLWNPDNTHILNGIDRYYAKNHDAVKHMTQHPKWKGLFNDPEESIFPAFWKNWVGIVPHEKARGMSTGGLNEGTDHTPYWNAIDPYLTRKSESELDMSVPAHTAEMQHQMIMQHGMIPALHIYYLHSAPRLLAAARSRVGR